MRRRFLLVPLCTSAVMACAPSMRTDSSVSPSRDLLLAKEIVMAQANDVYQAILQLRPEFLKRRGHEAPSIRERDGVRVYLDNIELGGVDELRSLPVDRVTAIRFVGSTQAMLRWGPSQPNGAIIVSTSRGGPDVLTP